MVNKSACKRISSLLSLYIDNKVTYQQSAFIEDHLANCEECHKKYLYLKSLIKDLKASYKQVLELAVKKQQQKKFSIREHEKFLENISPYVDNELGARECFEFRKYLMKSKNAQKELKSTYILQKEMRRSFDKIKNKSGVDVTKNVMNSLRNSNEKAYFETIREYVFTPKTFKIAILSGLILLGGYEFDQLYKQIRTPSPQSQVRQTQEKLTKPLASPSQKKADVSLSEILPKSDINP